MWRRKKEKKNKKKKEKPPRRTLRQRVGDGARTLGAIGDDLVHQPGVLPGKAGGWFRTWFGKLWKVRGGGLYALGYAVTFVILEIKAIFGDIVEAESVREFFSSQLFEFAFRFMSESMINFGLAFAWPMFVVQQAPVAGGIALGLAFILFPKYGKPTLERWLFGDEKP